MVKGWPASAWISPSNASDAAGEVLRQRDQLALVDQDAGRLHPRQHVDQGALDPFVDRGQAIRDQARAEDRVQPQREVGAGRGGIAHRVRPDRLDGNLVASAAQYVRERRRGAVEVELGQVLQRVVVEAAVEHPGGEHRIVDGSERQAPSAQQAQGALDVEGKLEDARVGEHRFENAERLVEAELRERLGCVQQVLARVAERHVAGVPRRGGEREADEAAAFRRAVCHEGLQRQHAARARRLRPAGERLRVRHERIGGGQGGRLLRLRLLVGQRRLSVLGLEPRRKST